MDFIQQLKAFDEKSTANLTPNAVAVYFKLFMMNNLKHWEEWFETTDSYLCLATGIARRESILKALNILQQKGYIEMERGGYHRPSKYKIKPLYNSAIDSGIDSGFDSAFDSAIDSGFDSAIDSAFDRHIIKHKHKTKTKTKTRAVFTPPTLDEVKAYCQERNSSVDPVRFFDYFTAGGWHDKNGTPVKSWKQKLITWENHSNGQSGNASAYDSTKAAMESLMEKYRTEGK